MKLRKCLKVNIPMQIIHLSKKDKNAFNENWNFHAKQNMPARRKEIIKCISLYLKVNLGHIRKSRQTSYPHRKKTCL